MMRVGFIFNHGEYVGGGEISFVELIDAIQHYDVHPVAFVPAYGGVYEQLRTMQIETVVFPFPTLRHPSALLFPIIGKRLAKKFQSLNLDLVHTNGARCMLYAGVAARHARIPCVWHVRVMERDGLLDRIRGRLASGVIANSNAVVATLKPLLPPNLSVNVIYNGIDLNAHAQSSPADVRKLFGLSAAPVILSVGRITPEKGLENLIKASMDLNRKLIAHSVVVAGPAPDPKYLGQLKAMAQQHELPGWVWAGLRNDVPSLMKGSTVLALSSHREGFSRVIVEAWASGLPVVATRQGGPAELIAHGDNGWLVAPNNIAELADGLGRLMADPALAQKLHNRGMKTAQQFTLDQMAGKTFDLYQALTA